MKTKSNSLFRVLSRRVLVTLLPRTRYLAAVSLMLVGVLLTGYSAVANELRDGMQEASSEADVSPEENDSDPEYVEKRTEFLNQFFGTAPGGVSSSAYASALVAVRALPLSPLLQGRKFISPETLEVVPPWAFPISPPIGNSCGNASARVHTLAIDPTSANMVYTGSFGGLAKTTDGGGTWRYLSDAWSSQSVSFIAIDPRAHNFVYVGTGRDGYAPYGVGLYRSFDGGATWSSPLGGAQFVGTYMRTIAIDPNACGSQSNTTVYVANGLSDNSGLWRSTNSGSTWTCLRQVGQAGSRTRHHGIHDVAIDRSTRPSTLYVTDDEGVFKSVDSGKTWTSIRDLPACAPNAGCALSRLSLVNSTLYLLGGVRENRNLYKYTIAGATWTQVPTNVGFSVFAVDPFNPNTILGGNPALYRTDNEGGTWTQIGSIHPDQQVIAFSPRARNIVYEGNDGGVVRSTDAGLQWTNLNQNLPGALMYSVALSADGSMMAGTQDNGAVYSNLGTPWYSLGGGDSAHDLIDPIGSIWAYKVTYIVHPDHDVAHAFQRIKRTAGPPYPWAYISPLELANDDACNFFPTFSMNPLSPRHLLAACQRVVRTLDATASPAPVWTTIGGSLADPGTSQVVTAAYEAPSNSDVIYAVRGYDTVFVTSNAGQGKDATWIQVTQSNHPGGIHAVVVHPTDPQTAYLACDSGIYKTTNMGLTWTQDGIPNLHYRDVAIDPANPEQIFAASYAGVFESPDGGVNWRNMSDGIPAGMMVTSLSYNPMSRQLAASTYGRGVYLLDLGEPPTVSISSSANLATTSEL
jgi:photosystem II stability/assembly factor-like uncharacterized protein